MVSTKNIVAVVATLASSVLTQQLSPELNKAVNSLAEDANSISNRVNSLTQGLRTKDGSTPGATAIIQYANGIESQIQSIVKTAENNGPGLSNTVTGTMLTPAMDSIAQGVEHLCGLLVDAKIDSTVGPELENLSSGLVQCATVARKNDMGLHEAQFSTLARQLAASSGSASQQPDLIARADQIPPAAQSIRRVQNILDELNRQLKGTQPNSEELAAFVSALEKHVARALDTVHEVLAGVGKVSNGVASSVLSPFFQAVTDCTSHFLRHVEDHVTDTMQPALQSLGKELRSCAALAEANSSPFASKFKELASKVETHESKLSPATSDVQLAARQPFDILGSIMGAFTNAAQRITGFVNDLTKPGARPGAIAVTNLITGIDGQIDNILALIANSLRPLTFGLSDLVMGFILGPTFQSVTDGIEVLIGNSLGGLADIALAPIARSLSYNVNRMSKVAQQNKMAKYAQKLQSQASQIQNFIAQVDSGPGGVNAAAAAASKPAGAAASQELSEAEILAQVQAQADQAAGKHGHRNFWGRKQY